MAVTWWMPAMGLRMRGFPSELCSGSGPKTATPNNEPVFLKGSERPSGDAQDPSLQPRAVLLLRGERRREVGAQEAELIALAEPGADGVGVLLLAVQPLLAVAVAQAGGA